MADHNAAAAAAGTPGIAPRTVALAHDPSSFSKIKHVARRHHFLRECVESGALDVGHISTDFNIADLFTKALEPKKFRLFRAAVMNLPIETLRA